PSTDPYSPETTHQYQSPSPTTASTSHSSTHSSPPPTLPRRASLGGAISIQTGDGHGWDRTSDLPRVKRRRRRLRKRRIPHGPAWLHAFGGSAASAPHGCRGAPPSFVSPLCHAVALSDNELCAACDSRVCVSRLGRNRGGRGRRRRARVAPRGVPRVEGAGGR